MNGPGQQICVSVSSNVFSFLEFQKRGQFPYEDVYLPQLADLRSSKVAPGSSVLHSEKSQGLNEDHEKQVYGWAIT